MPADSNFPWILFRLDQGHYAVSSQLVESLVKIDAIVAMPKQPACIRGVVNLRGRLIQMMDLRVRLNMTSLKEEVRAFEELMDARRGDHERWLQELKLATENGKPFTLTTDPHKCAFGRWYDAFHTSDNVLAQLLRQFDAPHKDIHAIADKVEAFKQAGDIAKAMEIIECCWNNELRTMVVLFESLKQAYRESKREIALILDGERVHRGLIVDEVVSVERLDLDESASLERLIPNWAASSGGLPLSAGKRRGDGSFVLLLTDPSALFGEAEAAGDAAGSV